MAAAKPARASGRRTAGTRSRTIITAGSRRVLRSRAWTARASWTFGAPWPAWPTRTSRAAPPRPAFGRHGRFIVDPRSRNDQQAPLAVSGNDHLAVLAAFQRPLQSIQTKAALWPFLSVAAQAAILQQRADVPSVSDSLLVRRGRQLAQIQFAPIHFIRPQYRAGGRYSKG